MENIKHLEKELWDAADKLRSSSEVTSDQYVKPVLGIIFMKYAEVRYKNALREIEEEINIKATEEEWTERQIRKAREDSDNNFKSHNALNLPTEAQFSYLASRSKDDVKDALKEASSKFVELREELKGVLPNEEFEAIPDDILYSLVQKFNSDLLNDINEDFIGRIYEYFVNEFARGGAQEDGMFFTPKSLVDLIARIIEPDHGNILDPACGSGGMFLQAYRYCKDNSRNFNACQIFGQELKPSTANICKMNLAVHSFSGNIASGLDASTYYHDYHNLVGKCDFVMANPPFNDGPVKAGDDLDNPKVRLPFGMPTINKKEKQINNANYLWLQYFYSFLNDKGRAGFVLASSASDASGDEAIVRENLVKSGAVDVMISVGNNFFYTKSLPCALWFYDKDKSESVKDKVLFIDARNYYTVVSRNLNEWTEWQRKNLASIVSLHRGQVDKYKVLVEEYCSYFHNAEARLPFVFVPDNQDNANTWICYCAVQNVLKECADAKTIIEQKETISKLLQYSKSEVKCYLDTIASANKEERKGIEDTFNASCYGSKTKRYKYSEIKKIISNVLEETESAISETLTVIETLEWLYSKFGDGIYKDIPGLCYSATLSEIAEHNYSLTPGAYVGIEEKQDEDEIPFRERLSQIDEELSALHDEANNLMGRIKADLKGIIA